MKLYKVVKEVESSYYSCLTGRLGCYYLEYTIGQPTVMVKGSFGLMCFEDYDYAKLFRDVTFLSFAKIAILEGDSTQIISTPSLVFADVHALSKCYKCYKEGQVVRSNYPPPGTVCVQSFTPERIVTYV